MTSSHARRIAAAFVVVAAIVAIPSTAAAHAVVLDVAPPAGAILDVAPSSVSISFNEPVTIDASGLVVIDESARAVSEPPTAEGATVRAAVPADATGWFVVSWHVVSADGHPLSGAWTYRVGEGTDAAPDDLLDQARRALEIDPVARWTWTVAQWGSALAVLVLVGTAFVMAITTPVAAQRRLALGAGLLAIVASLVAAAANGPHSGPNVGWFDGPASGEMLARAGLAAVAVVGVAVARGPAASTVARLVPLVAAAAAAAVSARSGHAGAEGGVALLAVMAHLVVAGCWLGAIPAVLIGVRPGGAVAREVLTRFSRAATVLLGAVLVIGLAGAAMLSGGPAEIADEWGLILVAKLAFVAMAALAGGWSRFNVLPVFDELSTAEVRRPLYAEAVIAVAVVTASIALTHNGPPREVTVPEPVVIVASDDDVTLQLVIDPGRVGTNEVHLYLTDPVGMPTAAEEVTMALASTEHGIAEIEIPLSNLGAGHHTTTTTDLGLAGTWEVRVVVRPTAFTRFEVVEPIEIAP